MHSAQRKRIFRSHGGFPIELSSWGLANAGTRVGRFLPAAAAATIEEKISDAAQVHSLTGACPSLALHVQWDFPRGVASVGNLKATCEFHHSRADRAFVPTEVFEPHESSRFSAHRMLGYYAAVRTNAILWLLRETRAKTTDHVIPG